MPALTGNGLAMRASTVLRALAGRHRVSLLVGSLYPPFDVAPPAPIAELCQQIEVLPPAPVPAEIAPHRSHPLLTWLRHPRQPARLTGQTRGSKPTFSDAPFDVVHVFRLASLRLAQPWLAETGQRPRRHLDLDDVESTTHRRLAALYRLNGDNALAEYEVAEAERHAASEAEILRTFDRIYVCSEHDRAVLARRVPGRRRARLCVLPNGLPVPEPLPARDGDGPFTILFIGALGYYPNTDAVLLLCQRIAPLIRQATGRDVRVAIVGGGLPSTVEAEVRGPGVHLAGAVTDVAPWYQAADAVVVPIRAGGGTRIKILEAFSYRRPVVSTSLGAEGIAAGPEEHLLIGDTPAEIAAQCVRLMTEPGLSDAISDRAFGLFNRAYTIEAVASAVAACD